MSRPTDPMSPLRIDSHQHFWRYDEREYPWISDAMGVLRRDFLPADLAPHLEANGFDGAIAVQARESVVETRWLLELANDDPRVLGVVGFVDLCREDTAERLAAVSHPKLRGVRHILQDDPDDRLMLRPEFGNGLRALADQGLCYDVLVFPRHLPHVRELVAEHRMRFVIDHLAKPAIASGEIATWTEDIRRVAEHDHVFCKVSGMVTEADWAKWRPEDLHACLDVVFDAFGPERLMFGTDWPVCLLAAGYDQVVAAVQDYMAAMPATDREQVFGATAARFYGIEGS